MQTEYNVTPAIAVPGMIADGSFRNIDSYSSEGNVNYGLLLQRGTADDQVKPMAAMPVADVDSIIETPVASAATAQEFSGSDFDGTIGTGLIQPAQLITMDISNHADWDASKAYIIGNGPNGQVVEYFDIPDAGNVQLVSKNVYTQVLKIGIGAQSGTGGTMTVGTSPDKVVLTQDFYPGVSVYEQAHEPGSQYSVLDGQQVSVMTEGRIFVTVEASCSKGGNVYVRTVESGSDVRGQFSGSDDGSNFALLSGAKFVSSADADGMAIVELRR